MRSGDSIWAYVFFVHARWAVLRDVWGSCYVVFRGSETVLDWTENSDLTKVTA